MHINIRDFCYSIRTITHRSSIHMDSNTRHLRAGYSVSADTGYSFWKLHDSTRDKRYLGFDLWLWLSMEFLGIHHTVAHIPFPTPCRCRISELHIPLSRNICMCGKASHNFTCVGDLTSSISTDKETIPVEGCSREHHTTLNWIHNSWTW
jgi:hypothetical protein